jgi:hypothetical protein
MSKLHWTAKDVFGLPGMQDDAKSAAITSGNDAYDAYVVYSNHILEKNKTYDSWDTSGYIKVLGLETDFEGDWRESLLVRPPEGIKISDFVKAWDSDEEPEDKNAWFGYVCEIRNHGNYPFTINNDIIFSHVRKMNPPTRIG